MIRRMMIGIVSLLALAAGVTMLKRRGGSQFGEHDAVQWPFDQAELRALMDRVIAEQRDRVSAIDDMAGRDRAQAFLDYYERRRRAIAS